MKRLIHTSAVLLGLLVATPAAHAAAITVQAGGISINSTDTTAAGTLADPWLINESMTSAGTLRFESEPLGADNPTGSGHDRGKWVQKTIINDTGITWTSFELELQVILGTASGQGDGLSFADGSALTDDFFSDEFSTYTRIDVLRDYLNFSGGEVLAGESVTFAFAITDNIANDPFYLLQTANKVDRLPEPGSLLLVALGLGGLAYARRRSGA
ncbi:MAG: PEP-CTERM sorting domain-containing protein [Burkholderiales bacterium]